MTDWADDIAQAMHDNWRAGADDDGYYCPNTDEIAAALRKAKADGMREAAQAARAAKWVPGPNASEKSKELIMFITSDFGKKISDAILVLAAEIEKGNE